jgi:shikimate kinase
MIIWLNGAFGVGKTTVGKELVSLLPEGKLSDPERIGYIMRRTFWRHVDYQDVPLWRRLTTRQVTRAGRRGTAVVAMTVIRPDVFSEVTAGARVFLLTASRSTLEDRIARSSEAREWRKTNLDRCIEAFGSTALGAPIDTDKRTPGEIAQVILDQL